MGVVYLARDARLDRGVAIKALPQEFAADAERLARFTREAKLLASLNHPNIASIFGLEEAGGARYLVLEYVAGDNLADRLARGALPVEDALAVCAQIAAGIEAAHEAGVIHRDLKPGNVILTEGGVAKVLDFGLARGGEGAESESGLSHSPTMTVGATRAGVLLGTAAYMSPEQARGRSVDRRADVWAFGCVLFECLTGKIAFEGETVSDTLAAVLKSEPDWSALPASTPRTVTRLLHRCLEKDARRRLRDIGDARLEIEEALASLRSGVRDDAIAPAASAAPWRRALPWAIAALASIVAIAVLVRRLPPSGSSAAVRAPTHVAIAFPAQHPIDAGRNIESFAISPDGRRLAYIEDVDDGPDRLAVRTLDSFDVSALTGTDFAANPFFSPDGEWIAYSNEASLAKVPVTGGATVKICDMEEATPGAAWAPDGMIVFPGGWSGGLLRVPASGGEPTPITRLVASRDEVSHRWPQILPDGRHVLFTVKTANMEWFDDALIEVCDMEGGEAKVVIEGGTFGRYMSGHIFYVRGGTLFAAPFDLGRLEVTGAARPVAERIVTWPASGLAWYAVSATGELVYAAGGPSLRPTSLVWVDREGRESAITSEPRNYQSPQISPDGSRLACWVGAANDKLWLFDLERGNLSRLTSGAGNDRGACWSPDGRTITFTSDRAGLGDIFRIPVDGDGSLDTLLMEPPRDVSSSVSPDGAYLAFMRLDPKTGGDIWLLSLAGDRTPRPFIASSFDEWDARFSPDGRWLAFASDESGEAEIYVTPFPGPVSKTQLSRGGGEAPRWARESGELFYRTEDSVAVVSLAAGGTRFGTPRMFCATNYPFVFDGSYDVAPDGKSLVFAKPDTTRVVVSHLNLVLNWGAKPAR
jgi:Tol biopolymer transport system component